MARGRTYGGKTGESQASDTGEPHFGGWLYVGGLVRGGKELFIVKRWTRSESKNGFRGGNCTTVFFLELKKREGRVGKGWLLGAWMVLYRRD